MYGTFCLQIPLPSSIDFLYPPERLHLNGPSPRESSGGERATLNTTINCEVPIDNSFRVALSPPAANCDPFFFRQHSIPLNTPLVDCGKQLFR